MSTVESIPEFIAVGSVAKCVNCFDEAMTGEVVGFDRALNILLLNSAMPDGKTKVNFINLAYAKSFELLKESTGASEPPSVTQSVNESKIRRRIDEETLRKSSSLCPPECSQEGRRLFVVIRKTIEDIRWLEESIEIFHSVLVHPPYTTQSVQIKPSHENVPQAQSTMEHVKKIVEKFWRNNEALSSGGGAKTSGSEEGSQ